MCRDCGCAAHDGGHIVSHSQSKEVANAAHGHRPADEARVINRLLAANDRAAHHNREHFDELGILAINLMSSPGAGKTALLEATIERLGSELRLAVIEGDLETENDAARIRAKGVPAVQITTGSACHLDAAMVHDALHELELGDIDVLFIENVGNLVCPASFDLGQHLNVVLLSTTEGDDKPAKYPVMFRNSDLVALTKTDLLPYLDDFRPDRATAALKASGYGGPVLTTSARNSAGMDEWLSWLRQSLAARRHRRPS